MGKQTGGCLLPKMILMHRSVLLNTRQNNWISSFSTCWIVARFYMSLSSRLLSPECIQILEFTEDPIPWYLKTWFKTVYWRNVSIWLNMLYYLCIFRSEPVRDSSHYEEEEEEEEILGSDDDEQEDPKDYCKGRKYLKSLKNVRGIWSNT